MYIPDFTTTTIMVISGDPERRLFSNYVSCLRVSQIKRAKWRPSS